MNTGKVSQVIGAVVDCEFEGKMPEILNAITVDQKGDEAKGIPDIRLTLEVASHLGDNKVRTVAMSPTDGLVRGMPAVDTGTNSARGPRNSGRSAVQGMNGGLSLATAAASRRTLRVTI